MTENDDFKVVLPPKEVAKKAAEQLSGNQPTDWCVAHGVECNDKKYGIDVNVCVMTADLYDSNNVYCIDPSGNEVACSIDRRNIGFRIALTPSQVSKIKMNPIVASTYKCGGYLQRKISEYSDDFYKKLYMGEIKATNWKYKNLLYDIIVDGCRTDSYFLPYMGGTYVTGASLAEYCYTDNNNLSNSFRFACYTPNFADGHLAKRRFGINRFLLRTDFKNTYFILSDLLHNICGDRLKDGGEINTLPKNGDSRFSSDGEMVKDAQPYAFSRDNIDWINVQDKNGEEWWVSQYVIGSDVPWRYMNGYLPELSKEIKPREGDAGYVPPRVVSHDSRTEQGMEGKQSQGHGIVG